MFLCLWSRETSWARDWLPVDFPESRIISIGYEVLLTQPLSMVLLNFRASGLSN